MKQRRYFIFAASAVSVGLYLVNSGKILFGTAEASDQKHPNVTGVKVKARAADQFDFDVTVSSPYDTAQRYADAFRVVDKDGTVYGERVLLHDHADEQPFTRDLYSVTIPRAVKVVTVQARDKQFGYGGKTAEVVLPGR